MLQIKNISKRLGDKKVLYQIGLEVPRSTFLTLLGPSGCGKTTLLRILAGFLVPDAGSIELGGVPISLPGNVVPPERRGMGMVFQNYAVWPHMTVLENVSYGLRLRKLPAREVRDRARDALRLVSLAGLGDRLPSELSGGQQQRVAIARSVATAPSVLLLDEPLSNLDAKLRKELLFDLKRIQQKSGITFVYVTHDQTEALSVSDQVAVMHEGCIEQIGPPRAIYDEPRNLFVASFVGNANNLRGKVESCDGRAIEVALARHGRLRLPAASVAPVGSTIDISIKRHGIRLTPAPAGVSEPSHGEVKRTYFLGQCEEICVDVGGAEIYAFGSPGQFAIGDRVAIAVEPGSFQLFTDAGGNLEPLDVAI